MSKITIEMEIVNRTRTVNVCFPDDQTIADFLRTLAAGYETTIKDLTDHFGLKSTDQLFKHLEDHPKHSLISMCEVFKKREATIG